MSDDPIFLTRQSAAAELVLNRPERRNAGRGEDGREAFAQDPQATCEAAGGVPPG